MTFSAGVGWFFALVGGSFATVIVALVLGTVVICVAHAAKQHIWVTVTLQCILGGAFIVGVFLLAGRFLFKPDPPADARFFEDVDTCVSKNCGQTGDHYLSSCLDTCRGHAMRLLKARTHAGQP